MTKTQVAKTQVTKPVNASKNQARPQSNVRPQTLAKSQNIGGASRVGINNEMPNKPKDQSNKLSWKAKNFLEDNDELEFGFLDFDDDE